MGQMGVGRGPDGSRFQMAVGVTRWEQVPDGDRGNRSGGQMGWE